MQCGFHEVGTWVGSMGHGWTLCLSSKPLYTQAPLPGEMFIQAVTCPSIVFCTSDPPSPHSVLPSFFQIANYPRYTFEAVLFWNVYNVTPCVCVCLCATSHWVCNVTLCVCFCVTSHRVCMCLCGGFACHMPCAFSCVSQHVSIDVCVMLLWREICVFLYV